MTATTIEALNRLIVRSPLNQWLACRVVAVDAATGIVELLLPDRPELHRSSDATVAHGGIVAALIDIAAHSALYASVGHGMPTIDLRVDYLQLAALPLRARAIPRRAGGTIGLADVEITDSDGRLSALGRAVFLTRKPTD